MQQGGETWIILAERLSAPQAAELALVLEASRIEHRHVATAQGYQLLVPEHSAALAEAQLTSYRRENVALPARRPPPPMIGTGWRGVAVYAGVLMLVAICMRQYAFGFDWLAAGGMDGARLRAGEWWRVITALTMHVDIDHLAANLAFGSFFTYFVARYYGAGLGWLAILSAGGCGNLLNGFLQSPEHRSIGASTAVFAALALLTVLAWRHGLWSATSWRARVAPLVAGIALLAYTGTGGENTDIGAHLTGFVAGFALGWIIVDARLIGADLQRTAAVSAVLLLTAAWISALALAG